MSDGSRMCVCFLGKADAAEIFGTTIFPTSKPVGGNTCYKTSNACFQVLKCLQYPRNNSLENKWQTSESLIQRIR